MTDRPEVQYERFSVVCFADEAVSGVIGELRRLIPPRIAVMPAHVTAKGSFIEPICLQTVQDRIADEARRSAPMQVQVHEVTIRTAHVGLRMESSPPLAALHDGLFAALEDLVRDVYGDKPGAEYHPHMAVFYGLTPEDHSKALELTPALQQIRAVRLGEVSLVGRIGGSQDGHWVEISSYPLGQ